MSNKNIKGESISFADEKSPEFYIGLYEKGDYLMSLDAGWDDSASVSLTREELIKVRDAINKVLA